MNKPYTLHLGDCLDSLRAMPDDSVDSIVTDPPYGLTANKKGGSGVASVNLENPYGRARITAGNGAGGFMGHKWDNDVPSVEIWTECLRVSSLAATCWRSPARAPSTAWRRASRIQGLRSAT